MDMHYIKVWLDWREATQNLKDAEKGRLIDAIVAYTNGEDTDELLTGNERFVFPVFRLQIDRDRAKLEQTSKARAAAGSMGGVAKVANASKRKQTVANDSKRSKDDKTIRQKTEDYKTEDEGQKTEDYTGDTGADAPKRPRAFVPPTPSAVREYCLQKGYAIDPEAFVDYYAKQGWKLSNGLPIRDWQACVRTWARRDQERGVQARPQSSGNAFADLVREGVFEDDDASVAF